MRPRADGGSSRPGGPLAARPCWRLLGRPGPVDAMASSFLSGVLDTYNYYNYELADPRFKDWWVTSSPPLMGGFLFFYAYFVTRLGPRLMKGRPPFQIDNLMVAYNGLQAAVSLTFSYLIFAYAIPTSGCFNFCDYCNTSIAQKGTTEHVIFKLIFWVRVLDFMDTLFMVLRKKNDQVSFLHVYHHIAVVTGAWLVGKYTHKVPFCHLAFLVGINSGVHAVMYTYYMMTALDPSFRSKLGKVKMYLSRIQIVQVVYLVTQAVLALRPSCKETPRGFLIFLFSLESFFLYLFLIFYFKSYTSRSKQPPTIGQKKETRKEDISRGPGFAGSIPQPRKTSRLPS